MKKKPTGKGIHKGMKNILKLIGKSQQGIKLDVGCGTNKQEGFVGLDIRPVPGVDIVHDAESVPYPLPDGCCGVILASHLVEHICPKKFIDVMNEWWRLMKVGGQLWISCPYGHSMGFLQDPSHCNAVNEATWAYFDPMVLADRTLFNIYQPKPWKTIRNEWKQTGNMEVILQKMAEVPNVETN